VDSSYKMASFNTFKRKQIGSIDRFTKSKKNKLKSSLIKQISV